LLGAPQRFEQRCHQRSGGCCGTVLGQCGGEVHVQQPAFLVGQVRADRRAERADRVPAVAVASECIKRVA
jgi:hypothetical protein